MCCSFGSVTVNESVSLVAWGDHLRDATRYNSFREADLREAACKSNTYLTLAHAKMSEQKIEGEGKLAASA
jgi:hypothetical protein